MTDLTFEATICRPHCTNELKESIDEAFRKAHRFYMKNRGKISYKLKDDITLFNFDLLDFPGINWYGNTLPDLEEDTPEAILKDF